MMKIMTECKDEILQVVLRSENNNDNEFFTVGRNGITKIEAYNENGQMAAVPWIAVYVNDKIVERFDAVNCIVIYKDGE